MLATGGDDSQVHLWNVRDPNRPVPLGTINDTGGLIFALAFRPGGTILAVATSDNTARLWDLTDPTDRHQLGGPLDGFTGYVYGVAFSPDGLTLAVGSADRTVRLWNVADPRRPAPLGTPFDRADQRRVLGDLQPRRPHPRRRRRRSGDPALGHSTGACGVLGMCHRRNPGHPGRVEPVRARGPVRPALLKPSP